MSLVLRGRGGSPVLGPSPRLGLLSAAPMGAHPSGRGSAGDFHPGDLPVLLLTQDWDLLAQAW